MDFRSYAARLRSGVSRDDRVLLSGTTWGTLDCDPCNRAAIGVNEMQNESGEKTMIFPSTVYWV